MGDKKMDAAMEELSVFTEPPELTPVEQVEAESYIEPLAEQLDELKAAGINVPEKEHSFEASLSDGFSGIEQGFTSSADLPIEAQVEAESYIEPLKEQLEELKAAGIHVPETEHSFKASLSDGFSGIEQGFTVSPEMEPEEVIEAESYIVSGKESVDEIKELLNK